MTILLKESTVAANSPVERRVHKRHPFQRKCLVRTKSTTLPNIEDWHGVAYDISAGGIGIALPFIFPVGTILTIEAWGVKRAKILHARVVRSCLVEFMWFHGCELTEHLSHKQLETWLGRKVH